MKTDPSTPIRYVIISPVKDEEKYVESTLRSVVSQTLKPVMWIIVDDNSKDRTPEIIDKYSSNYPFIQIVKNQNSGTRNIGVPVIRSFNCGLKFVREIEYDFIVKLDCDLDFGEDYFEKLLCRFNEEKNLGIGSGMYLELNQKGMWTEVLMPSYHAAGACKVIRKNCFEQIGGFIAAPGWDTVDEIRAIAFGWKTGHFRDLQMRHLKPEGSGIGNIRTSVMHGEIYYLTGGSFLFFIFKFLQRIYSRPYFIKAFALLWGYFRAKTVGKALLVNKAEAKHYNDLLHTRLKKELISHLKFN